MKRYFECVQGTSAKFWEAWTEEGELHTRYGKIGTTGQTTIKLTDSPLAAQKLLDRLIGEKTNKGYKEVARAADGAANPSPSKGPADGATAAAEDVRFQDIGLHMAVLGAAADVDAAFRKKLDAFLGKLKPKHDIDEDEEAAIQDGLKRLHKLGIPGKVVAAITQLGFDGGAEIYMNFEDAIGGDGFTTGGEEDYYQVQSLRGIEALGSLTDLDLDGYGASCDPSEAVDLSPLAALTRLRTLSVSGYVTGGNAIGTLSLDRLRWDSDDNPGVPLQVRCFRTTNFMTLDRLQILQGATIAELSLFFSSPTEVPATLAILRQVKGLKKVELGGGFPAKLKQAVQELGIEVTTS